MNKKRPSFRDQRPGQKHEYFPTPHIKTQAPRPEHPHTGSVNGFWLYGLHAARAALANPKRRVRRIVVTERVADELRAELSGKSAETATPDVIGRLCGAGSVHQGIGLLCDPLPEIELEIVLDSFAAGNRIVAVLDQITDPHNEGAILRSAAAFGVSAVVVQSRHAAPESGALAKAASGALDRIARITVVNIARTLEELGRMGFWRIALAGDGDAALTESFRPGDVAIALGAEGAGLRRLVRERCDISAFIPTEGASLNVSNAAAVALYEIKRGSLDR